MTNELKLLTAVRPPYAVRDVPPPLDWDAMELASTEGEVAGERTSPRPPRWVWLAAAAAVLVVFGAVQVFRQDDHSAHAGPSAATSSRSAAPTERGAVLTPQLAELADIAAMQGIAGEGDVRYVKFSTSTNSGSQLLSRSEYWIAPDLSGLVRHDVAPTQGVPDGPFAPDGGPVIEQWCWLGDAASVLMDVRTDPDAIYGANGLMWLFQYCALSGPPSPVAQATLLGELATAEGVTSLGMKSDPLGRSGEAFTSLVAVPDTDRFDQSTVIFDRDTGALLAFIRAQVGSIEDTTIPPNALWVAIEDTSMVPEVGGRPS